MHKLLFVTTAAAILAGCTSLTFQEKQELSNLQYRGVSVDRGPAGWEKPASPFLAGALNLLPGIGNFYLASGNASDSAQWIYGFGNLLTWPFSIVWGIPEAAIDADNINKRDMLNYLKYGNQGVMQVRAAPAAPMNQHYGAPYAQPPRTPYAQPPYANPYRTETIYR